MKTLYDYIRDLQVDDWHYYYGIDNKIQPKKPFVESIPYADFIKEYFKQGQKIEVYESCNIDFDSLRLPNHICSVFFLGLVIYYNTSLRFRIKPKTNESNYRTFPFIWFLTTLFHDSAYQMEDKTQLTDVKTLADLYEHFNINHKLLEANFSRCPHLLAVRHNYFLFRKNQYGVVDHGLLGGILLYDRLVKIRRRKRQANEETLFWGIRLENQYKLAASAISIHNIWLQNAETRRNYNLMEFENYVPVGLSDFPLFYLLAIIDTLEPLKIYRSDKVSDLDILKSISLSFKNKSIVFSKSDKCKIDFEKIILQLCYFDNWINLDINVAPERDKFIISFQ